MKKLFIGLLLMSLSAISHAQDCNKFLDEIRKLSGFTEAIEVFECSKFEKEEDWKTDSCAIVYKESNEQSYLAFKNEDRNFVVLNTLLDLGNPKFHGQQRITNGQGSPIYTNEIDGTFANHKITEFKFYKTSPGDASKIDENSNFIPYQYCKNITYKY